MSEVESRGKARTDAETPDADPDGAVAPDTETAADDADAATAGSGDVDAAAEGSGDADAAAEGSGDADAAAAESGDDEGSDDQGKPRPKVKMPQAQEINRGDFTPHALRAKARPSTRSGTRAAAKRRRILYTTGGAVVVLLVIGAFVAYANRPAPSVKVRGAFGKAPSFAVPKAKPAPKKQIKELIHGSGAAVAKDDFVVLQLVGYKWSASGGKELLNTYRRGMPALGPSSRLTGLPALDNAIAGRRPGSRIQLTLPYRDVGDQIAQQLQLGRTDDFVVTVDLMAAFGKTATAKGTPQNVTDKNLPAVTAGAPGKPPTIKIPSAAEPSKLQVKPLIQGTGPVVAKGKTLIAQYHGVLWRDGKVFDSTYQRGAPAAFPIGVKQVIPAWDQGLVGQKVGSRVLLVVPPKDGYGAKGTPDGKIKGNDTLVFVVDILGSY
jgi:FKBP-type peptidyl-prolyl cis-trans isomerase